MPCQVHSCKHLHTHTHAGAHWALHLAIDSLQQQQQQRQHGQMQSLRSPHPITGLSPGIILPMTYHVGCSVIWLSTTVRQASKMQLLYHQSWPLGFEQHGTRGKPYAPCAKVLYPSSSSAPLLLHASILPGHGAAASGMICPSGPLLPTQLL